jgi:hypothetical protein
MFILYLFLFLQFTFFASENVPETIRLTLQYDNLKRVSRLWNIDDFNKLGTIKKALEDTELTDTYSKNKTGRIFPLSKEHSHVTHGYLKNLITGNFKNDHQYVEDYIYFIGNNDIDLYEETATTVKKKVLRKHLFRLSEKCNQPLIRNFFSYDLSGFLQKTLHIDFENFDKKMLLNNEINLKMSTDEIIDLIKPVINIEINNFSMSIESRRYLMVDSPCLVNLIQLIAWKKYLENENEVLNDEQLRNKFLRFFEDDNEKIEKIYFKNFIFLDLHIEKILDITRNISFIDSSTTLSDNDITALQKIRNTNITLPCEPFNPYGPYWIGYAYGGKYKKHSLEINFSTSYVTNPDKALELIDLYNGYFQTIFLKNIPVDKTKLWFKKLLCRKWARFKFCISILVNLCILGTLLLKGGLTWKLFILSIGGGISFIMQSIIYWRMINYPENAMHDWTRERFETNGGVAFE